MHRAAASRDKAVSISKVIVPERANDCDTTLAFAAESRRKRVGDWGGEAEGEPSLSGPACRPAGTRAEDRAILHCRVPYGRVYELRSVTLFPNSNSSSRVERKVDCNNARTAWLRITLFILSGFRKKKKEKK